MSLFDGLEDADGDFGSLMDVGEGESLSFSYRLCFPLVLRH